MDHNINSNTYMDVYNESNWHMHGLKHTYFYVEDVQNALIDILNYIINCYQP